MAGERLAGAYGMLAWQSGEDGDRLAVGWCQFGPISRLSARPGDPRPIPGAPRLAGAVGGDLPAGRSKPSRIARRPPRRCSLPSASDLDRRGIIAVEAYPEGVADAWLPSPGPASVYERAGFARVAGEDRFPVYRRELSGEGAEVGWGDLLARTPPEDEGDDWPLPLPKGPTEEDLFRLPEKPKRPNPFGEDE